MSQDPNAPFGYTKPTVGTGTYSPTANAPQGYNASRAPAAPPAGGFPSDYNPGAVTNNNDPNKVYGGRQVGNVSAPAGDYGREAVSGINSVAARGPLDLSTAGAGEDYYAQNAGRYTAPTQSSQYWGQHSGDVAGPGAGENYAKNLLAQYGNGGALPQDPGLDKYYDNQWRRASEGINQQMAARGLYGSSAATDQLAESRTNLAADQASKEAQYNLQRSQNQLGWAQGLGNMAFGAQGAAMNRFGAGLQGSGQADSTNLGYLNAGANASGNAQQLQQGRAQQLFGNEMAMAGSTAGLAKGYYDPMFAADTGLTEDALMGRSAAASESYNQAKTNGLNQKDWFDNLVEGGMGLTQGYLNAQTGGASGAVIPKGG